MTPDPLNEREFELINIVGGALAANQRDLSRQMNLSLGMTNMVLKRLVTKGYIRIKQLDRRKVEYILTPKGFAEKMRKSIRYTMKTINSIGMIHQGVVRLVRDLHTQGFSKFYVLGSLDLTVLIENVLRQEYAAAYSFMRITQASEAKPDGVLLICLEEVQNIPSGVHAVNMIEELAKTHFNGTSYE